MSVKITMPTELKAIAKEIDSLIFNSKFNEEFCSKVRSFINMFLDVYYSPKEEGMKIETYEKDIPGITAKLRLPSNVSDDEIYEAYKRVLNWRRGALQIWNWELPKELLTEMNLNKYNPEIRGKTPKSPKPFFYEIMSKGYISFLKKAVFSPWTLLMTCGYLEITTSEFDFSTKYVLVYGTKTNSNYILDDDSMWQIESSETIEHELF